MGEELRLSDANRETIRNFLQAFVQRDAEFDPKPDLEKVVNEFDDYISRATTIYRMSMITLIKSLELSTIAQGYRHTFSKLSPKEQKDYLTKMETSSNYAFRGIALGIKSIAIIIYFSEPEAEKALGYDGKCLADAKA